MRVEAMIDHDKNNTSFDSSQANKEDYSVACWGGHPAKKKIKTTGSINDLVVNNLTTKKITKNLPLFYSLHAKYISSYVIHYTLKT